MDFNIEPCKNGFILAVTTPDDYDRDRYVFITLDEVLQFIPTINKEKK